MPQTRRTRSSTSETPEKVDPAKEVKDEETPEVNEEPPKDKEEEPSTEVETQAQPQPPAETAEETTGEEKESETAEKQNAENAEKVADETVKKDGDEETETKESEEESAKKKIPIELDEKAKTDVVVVVGYITYADLGMTELKLPLLKCTHFEMRFFSDEDNKKGYLTMYFTKSWDAYVAVDKLRGLEVPRGENTCNYSCWLLNKPTAHSIMHQEAATLRQLRTQLNSNNEQDPSLRSLFVANIPKSATKELLTAIFAEAQDIVLPLAEPGKNKGYCYIEFNDAEKLDEYLTKYQDIKIEDGEVSAKIVIRKLGKCLSAPVTEKTKDRVNRMLKSRAKQQIPDLGKKAMSESNGRKGRARGKGSNFRGNMNRDRFRQYNKSRRYGGGFGGDRRDSNRRSDDGAMALAAIQQLLSQQQMMNRGGRGGGGGGGGGGNFRSGKRRFPGSGGGYDEYGGGMAKNRRFDSPMGMDGPQHFYDDNYDNWGSGSFQQGYGSGSGGYGGGGGGGYGGNAAGSGMGGGYGDGRRRKNFGGKFYKHRN